MTDVQKTTVKQLKSSGLTMIQILKIFRDTDNQVTNDDMKQVFNNA
jgi:hypothetical protein